MAEDWRAKHTAVTCLEFLCMNDIMSDVTFLFETEAGKRTLPGHRFILAMRSPVFEAMFYGPIAETNTEIVIEDIDFLVFGHMLRFIYTDALDIHESSLCDLLYATSKYCIDALTEKCVTLLEKTAMPDNVCSLHEVATFYGDKRLENFCVDYICENASAVFETEDFFELGQDGLRDVLASNDLALEDEIDVFKGAVKWAVHQCEKTKLEATGNNIRLLLGNAFCQVRFPLMAKEDLPDVVDSQVLTLTEETLLLTSGTEEDSFLKKHSFPCRLRESPMYEIIFQLKGNAQPNLVGGACKLQLNCDHRIRLRKIRLRPRCVSNTEFVQINGSYISADRNSPGKLELDDIPTLGLAEVPIDEHLFFYPAVQYSIRISRVGEVMEMYEVAFKLVENIKDVNVVLSGNQGCVYSLFFSKC